MQVIYFKPGYQRLPEAFAVMDIKDELDTYYKLINCDSIDITTASFNGLRVNVVVDDIGCFRDDIKVSIFTRDNYTHLVGNVVITGLANKEGELTGLSDNDIKIIRSCARICAGVGELPSICLVADEH